MQTAKEMRQELKDGGYLAVCPKCFHGNDMDFNMHSARTCAKCGTRFQVDADKSDSYKLLHCGQGYNKNFSLENALARRAELEAKERIKSDARPKAEQQKVEDAERQARMESFKLELKQAEERGRKKRYVERENPLIKNAKKRAQSS